MPDQPDEPIEHDPEDIGELQDPPEDWLASHERKHRVLAEHYPELLTVGVIGNSFVFRYTGTDHGARMMSGPLSDHPIAAMHEMGGCQDFTLVMRVDGDLPTFLDDDDDEVEV